MLFQLMMLLYLSLINANEVEKNEDDTNYSISLTASDPDILTNQQSLRFEASSDKTSLVTVGVSNVLTQVRLP